jgi:putative membrane protein
MKHAIAFGVVMAASLGFCQNLAEHDRNFAMQAARGGLMEVEMGKLAASKAENADVKSFGQRMVDDHSKANDALKQAVANKKINLPAEVDAKEKAELDKLSGMSGAAFDRHYMQIMVTDHKKDVAEFERAARTAKDSDIKKFAADTVPTLKEHLQQAEKVLAEVRTGRAKGKK